MGKCVKMDLCNRSMKVCALAYVFFIDACCLYIAKAKGGELRKEKICVFLNEGAYGRTKKQLSENAIPRLAQSFFVQ